MALKTVALPRAFYSSGRKLADPNPALSIEEVRAHYAGILPESTTPHLRRDHRNRDKITSARLLDTRADPMRPQSERLIPNRVSTCWPSCKRIGRQERTPNEQMIASFVQCERHRSVQSRRRVLGRHRYNERPIPPRAPCFPGCNDDDPANAGLVLPFVNTVPTSFTYTKGRTRRYLGPYTRRFGLGSPELWKRFNGNISRFIRDSISAWLSDIGAD